MTNPDADRVALVARLGDALGAAVAPANLDRELSSAVSGIREVFGAAACSFAQVQPDGDTLRFVAADGAGAEQIVGVVLPVSRGIAGWVAMSGEPIQVADVATDQRFARDVAESTDFVPSTILAAPVEGRNGDMAGVVEVLDPADAGERDPAHDLAVLGLVASQLGSIVRLSALYDAIGTGVIRSLADPEASGAFDDALASIADPDAGVALTGLAEVFRELAGAGPAAARMAERVLVEVATYAAQSSRATGRGRPAPPAP
jgi:hypothetical protein